MGIPPEINIMTTSERINKMTKQEQRRNIADLMAKAYNWLYEYWQRLCHKEVCEWGLEISTDFS